MHVAISYFLCAILSALTTMGIVVATYYIWHHHLKWKLAFRKYSQKYHHEGNPEAADTETYTLFVGYCGDDTKFVFDQLIRKFEDRCNFTCYFYHRDADVGTDLAQEITTKMERSKGVILVCSDKYLSMKWHQFELQIALYNATTLTNRRLLLLKMPEDGSASALQNATYTSFSGYHQRMIDANKQQIKVDKVPEALVITDQKVEEYVAFFGPTLSQPARRAMTVYEPVWRQSSYEQYTFHIPIECIRCRTVFHLLQKNVALCYNCKTKENDQVELTQPFSNGLQGFTAVGRETDTTSPDTRLSMLVEGYLVTSQENEHSGPNGEPLRHENHMDEGKRLSKSYPEGLQELADILNSQESSKAALAKERLLSIRKSLQINSLVVSEEMFQQESAKKLFEIVFSTMHEDTSV